MLVMTLPIAAIWNDLLVPTILAVVGAAVAWAFPWFQSYWRGRKFQGIIKRELEELAPYPRYPVINTPWWTHLRKRFVHEEIFARREISGNRDFLLSLNPDVVYNVSQLWTALETRDAVQWLHYLHALALDRRVGSERLFAAHHAWAHLIGDTTHVRPAHRARDSRTASCDSVAQARLVSYGSLLGLTRYGSEHEPLRLPADERAQRATELMDWFYRGGGLLLSGQSLVALLVAHDRLTNEEASDSDRRNAFSALRTELKIDLGVRDADERSLQMASLPPLI
jgi:hypothetical protein